MTLNYLFFIGIGIPVVVTIGLFIVFLVCWNKYRIRKDVMTKKHDPHKRTTSVAGSIAGSSETYMYRVPRPPLPPKWIYRTNSSQDSQCILPRDNEAFDASPSTPGVQFDHQSRQIYNTFHDSGMSDLSEFQYKYEQQRPNSQASTDSEDSGFRSSRSGQYLHSAQNSNAQEVPLFKPIISSNTNNKDNLSPQQQTQIVNNTHLSDKNQIPSRHSKRKNKSPNVHRTQKECIDLSEIHIHKSSPHLSVISPNRGQGQLTFTTATVHRSSLDDHHAPPMAYSVV